MSKSKTATGKSEGEKTAGKPAPVTWSRTLRETIESVVIAFVLAFLFRTFEAEAFVIPTGSMAPTLMGQHKDISCNECGVTFRVGATEDHGVLTQCICPNCRYVNDLEVVCAKC